MPQASKQRDVDRMVALLLQKLGVNAACAVLRCAMQGDDRFQGILEHTVTRSPALLDNLCAKLKSCMPTGGSTGVKVVEECLEAALKHSTDGVEAFTVCGKVCSLCYF
jgi:hypothetical protein